MFFYDVIVELMNIHEIKCKISNQAISGTSHGNLMRFFAIRFLFSMSLKFQETKTLDMTFNMFKLKQNLKTKESKLKLYVL